MLTPPTLYTKPLMIAIDIPQYFFPYTTEWTTATINCLVTFTFTFINLADAFFQSDLQLRNTISDTL